MIVWVVGGAGFIGSHLCEALLAAGHQVRCLDNLSSGSMDNLKGCENNPNFRFVERDVCYPWPVPIGNRRPDLVYCLASFASPVDYLNKPVETIMANTQGVKNMLDFCQEVNARFVYCSTSEVYGDPKESPQREGLSGELNPESPRAPYYASKGVGEALVYAYRKKGLIASCVRIFNTYGPRMRIDDGRCVPTFIHKALRNEDVPVHGDGSQTRSMCYVTDTVEALVLVGEQEESVGPINVGNDLEISMLALAKFIIAVTGSESKIVYGKRIADDPNRRCPDITKIYRELGWSPEISLKEGIIKTIESFYEKESTVRRAGVYDCGWAGTPANGRSDAAQG